MTVTSAAPRLAARRFPGDPSGTRSIAAHPMQDRFITDDSSVDVAVVIVTYNSAEHIRPLIASLRAASADLRLRVIVADNQSADETLRVVAEESDVVRVDTGGNLGYSNGINSAMRHAGRADALLILNPDLLVEPDAIRAMLNRLAASGAGVVVPQVLDARGVVYPSIRREPTVGRAIGDALFGSHLRRRPSWASEIDVDADSYLRAHPIDWATGAALMIDFRVAALIGEWDPQFFLYSEETDFFRRVRDAGFSIWYEPTARVRHEQGGSGTSDELLTLMAVNRVRYARKYRPGAYSAVFRGVVMLHAAMRSYTRAHRAMLRTLANERSWRQLPEATRRATTTSPLTRGTIVIPAYNEAAVVAKTLQRLQPLIESTDIEIIVACNGCVDDTAAVARSFDGVLVLDLPEPSKTAAMNAADSVATSWPRLYLDADVTINSGAVIDTFAMLSSEGTPAARPPYRWDTTGASFLVRRYYGARSRLLRGSTALWGAGAYAVSEAGHSRFGHFPPVTADDVFVDLTFAPAEKCVVDTEPIVVMTPRTNGSLLAVLHRQVRGATEQNSVTGGPSMRRLVSTVRGPKSLLDAAVYAAFAALSRAPRRGPQRWETDRSTRISG